MRLRARIKTSGLILLVGGGLLAACDPDAAGDGSWGAPVEYGVEAFNPDAAISPAGDVVVAWERGRLARSFFFSDMVSAAGLSAAESWSPRAPQLLYQREFGTESLAPKVATAPDGRALAAWVDYFGGVIRSSVFDPGRGWTLPTPVPTLDRSANLAVALDATGNGLVVAANTREALGASRYTRGGGFEAAVAIAGSGSGPFRLAMSPRGQAFVAWGGERPFVRDFDPRTGWSPAQGLPGRAVGSVTIEAAAFDGADGAVLLWREAPPYLGPYDAPLVASRRRNGAWGPPVLVAAVALEVRLALGPGGGGVAIWTQTSPPGLAASRLSAQGWGPEESIAAGQAGMRPDSPALALDARGHATVAWGQRSGDPSQLVDATLWTARSLAGRAWTPPQQVGETLSLPRHLWLGADPAGNVLLLWTQGVGQYPSGSSALWGARFTKR